MSQTFSVDFITRTCKSDKTRAQIFARITIDGDRKEISIKEPILKADWIPKAEQVKGRSEHSRSLNDHIDDVREKIKHT